MNQTDSFSASRRLFLKYVGAVSVVTGLSSCGLLSSSFRDKLAALAPSPWSRSHSGPGWEDVPYPVPLPWSTLSSEEERVAFAKFQVKDELQVPAGFSYRVIASWGQVFGPATNPEQCIHFGYNCDYTALTPRPQHPAEYFLLVNHEYVSARPWAEMYSQVKGTSLPDLRIVKNSANAEDPGTLALRDLVLESNVLNLRQDFKAGSREKVFADACSLLSKAALEEMGVSILHVKELANGQFEVIQDSNLHRRIHTYGQENIAANAVMEMTGPGSKALPVPQGTCSNCSGGQTSWGTFLTCEENFQDSLPELISPQGDILQEKYFSGSKPDARLSLPVIWEGIGQGSPVPLDGRNYGWVCEIDPLTGGMRKHMALGRFRHENVTLQVEKGEPLVAYMGDDRRGGHVWKFVSDGRVEDVSSPSNSGLFENGKLFVARFEPNFTGSWILLDPKTPLRIPEPEYCATEHMWLPKRPHGGTISVGTKSSTDAEIEVKEWIAQIEKFCGKNFAHCTLADLVEPEKMSEFASISIENARQAILLMDAFAMANAIGGTPLARPEDLELHPHDRSVYIAFTDSTGKHEGSPDTRIFPDSKGKNSRQYGAIYRIEETNSNSSAMTFSWGKFIASGEVAEGGGGFACADNLLFDADANLWMVCDISGDALNFPVIREGKSRPGEKAFPGIFGNNALFMIPCAGKDIGIPHCFAIGPMECELTGPTFSLSGKALLLSVQHPGETNGSFSENKIISLKISGLKGQTISQERVVPCGSNFPHSGPKPSLVCITKNE